MADRPDGSTDDADGGHRPVTVTAALIQVLDGYPVAPDQQCAICMNNRLSTLAGKGLVEKVGPAERSGVYEITDPVRAALDHREEYSHDDARAFRALIEREVDAEANS